MTPTAERPDLDGSRMTLTTHRGCVRMPSRARLPSRLGVTQRRRGGAGQRGLPWGRSRVHVWRFDRRPVKSCRHSSILLGIYFLTSKSASIQVVIALAVPALCRCTCPAVRPGRLPALHVLGHGLRQMLNPERPAQEAGRIAHASLDLAMRLPPGPCPTRQLVELSQQLSIGRPSGPLVGRRSARVAAVVPGMASFTCASPLDIGLDSTAGRLDGTFCSARSPGLAETFRMLVGSMSKVT